MQDKNGENGYLRKSDFWKIIAIVLAHSLAIVFAAGILYNKLSIIERELEKTQARQEKIQDSQRELRELLHSTNSRIMLLESKNR